MLHSFPLRFLSLYIITEKRVPAMRPSSSSSLLLAGFLALLHQSIAAPSPQLGARALDPFVASERATALQGALNNIGPNGSKVPGAGPGFVVASPSKANPNCTYLPLFT